YFFFFQAEDGIRDFHVTGVQTCALPICRKEEVLSLGDPDGNTYDLEHHLLDCASVLRAIIQVEPNGLYKILADRYQGKRFNSPRSEERRVGKECRYQRPRSQ